MTSYVSRYVRQILDDSESSSAMMKCLEAGKPYVQNQFIVVVSTVIRDLMTPSFGDILNSNR
jgi:hypothetical protein